MTSKRYLTVADYGILTKVVICSLSVVKEAKLNLDEKRRKLARQWVFMWGSKMVGKERRPDLQRKVKEEVGKSKMRKTAT